jgi:hypothetical protein
MQIHLYSQLLKLDLSNDDLLQMYYVIYYDLKQEDREMADNISRLIEIREKAKLELRKLLFQIRNSIQTSKVGTAVLNFLPVFLKLDYLARNTFKNLNLKACYEKEKKNIKLYYDTLYNQDIPSSTLDVLLMQKRKLESLP